MRQALGFLCRDGSANAALLGPRYKVTFLESDEQPCSILQSRFAVAVLAKTIRCQNAASRGLGSLRRRTARVRSLPRTRKQEGSPRRRSLLAGPRRARGKHHPSADEPSRRPPTRRDPYAAHHRDARRAGSGLHLAVFCEPHFTWAAAAETLPQRSAQTTHAWRQNGLRPLATEAEAAVAPEARFSRAIGLGAQR